MNYEKLLEKLIGKKVTIYFSRDFFVEGLVLAVDSEMLKLKDTDNSFIYIEFLQDIKCVITSEDVKLEEE